MAIFFCRSPPPPAPSVFFFNDTATTEIYTLSLHDALPISQVRHPQAFFDESVDEVAYSVPHGAGGRLVQDKHLQQLGEQGASFTIIAVYHFYHFIITSVPQDRKSTRLNSSHT